jgi:hypothetical protein
MEKENIGASHPNNTPYSNVTPIHVENDYTTSSTPKSDEKDVIANSDPDDDNCSEGHEVPGTIPHPKFNMNV